MLNRAFDDYIARYEDLSENTVKADTLSDNSAEIDTVTAEIKTIEKRTEEIISLYVTATIDFDTYQIMVKQGNERRGELESRLSHLQNAQQARIPTYTAKDIVTNIREHWSELDNEQRLQFIQQFIKSMVVHKAGREVTVKGLLFNEF